MGLAAVIVPLGKKPESSGTAKGARLHTLVAAPGPPCAQIRLLQRPKMRGLYTGLLRGKQKLQKRPDALRPACFIMFSPVNALVMQVAIQSPPFAQQDVAEPLDVAHDARAFPRANIQPDARQGTTRSRIGN